MATSADKRRALNHYDAYKRSGMYSLRDAYGSYSGAKQSAWEYCERLMDSKSGWGLKVIGANTHMFSAGFEFCGEEGQLMFMYITRTNDIAVEVE
jgi:hypothetical protein